MRWVVAVFFRLFWHPLQWFSALVNLAVLAVLLGTDWAGRLTR